MQPRLIATALAAACVLSACAMGNENMRPGASPAPSMQDSMSSDTAMPPPTMEDPMVGGSRMSPTRTIVENAMNSQDHTTLVAAVKAAGLAGTLMGPGPFTVFAPTNAAFDALPAGTVDRLMRPSMKADLAKVLTYHVVPGNLDSMALVARVRAGGGRAVLKTVQGESLTLSMSGNNVIVADAKGGMATVTIADVRQSNGVIHVVDKVLMP